MPKTYGKEVNEGDTASLYLDTLKMKSDLTISEILTGACKPPNDIYVVRFYFSKGAEFRVGNYWLFVITLRCKERRSSRANLPC